MDPQDHSMVIALPHVIRSLHLWEAGEGKGEGKREGKRGSNRLLCQEAPKCVLINGFQLDPKDNHMCVASERNP